MDMTIDEIIGAAIASEQAAISLYRGLIEMVTDPSTKGALEYLADEEVRHKEILEAYRRGEISSGTLDPSSVVDGKLVEYLGASSFDPSWRPEDAFLVAAKQEKAAHDFYVKLAREHPEGKAKELLSSLARQELAHKEKVEYLYANTAFPQTDGG